MANASNTQINGLLPLDLSELSIVELCQAYEGAQAADFALVATFHRPDVDRESGSADWMDEQAQLFTSQCQHIRDELMKRPEPNCGIEAAQRRECVIGYALRCGDETKDLIATLVALEQGFKQAA